MKLIPFSRDFCKVLISSGYSYFVKQRHRREDDMTDNRRTTYRATRNVSAEKDVVPISDVLNESVMVSEDSYIMVAE